MATINVQGVGDIELPDGMSQQEMEEAINSNPSVQSYVQKSATTNVPMLKGTGTMPYNYSNDPVGQNLHQLAKGVPVVRNFVPDKPQDAQFEKDHPYVSRAERITGAVAGAAPMAMAAALPEAGVGANMAVQGGLFGTLGTADSAANKYQHGGVDEVKNTPMSEWGHTFGIDALLGALGEGAGRLLSPNAIPHPKQLRPEDAPKEPFIQPPSAPPSSEFKIPDKAKPTQPEKTYGPWDQPPATLSKYSPDELSALNPPTGTRDLIYDALNKGNVSQRAKDIRDIKIAAGPSAEKFGDAMAALTGGGIGYAAGGAESAILGAIVGPYLKEATKRIIGPVSSKAYSAYAGNQLMSNPANKAILQSLIAAPNTSN